MSRNVRVLIVSPIPSHPQDQGNSARIWSFGNELMQRGVEADFFYYGMEGLSKEQQAAMAAFWTRFTFMPSLPLSPPAHASAWGLDDWCPAALCERVADIARTRSYDAIIVNYVWMSRVLEGIEGPLKIIDTHDLFGGRQDVAMEQGLEPRWFFTTVAEESRGFARADLVIAIQDEEEKEIARRASGPVTTVGHPIAPLFLTRKPKGPPLIPFGYLGSGNPFNIRCITALDDALVRNGRRVPWALAGTISRRNLSLRSHPTRIGMVNALEDFYDKVDCVLNPMLGGTGLKIKTIEALSYGKPIIGTPSAFEGLAPTFSLHRLETLDAFVAGLQAFMEKPELRADLRLESRKLALRYMLTVERQYDALVDRIAGARAARPPARVPAPA